MAQSYLTNYENIRVNRRIPIARNRLDNIRKVVDV
jgi:hypothetical protein